MSIFDTKKRTFLNEIDYEFELYLDNSAGENDNRKYYINPAGIINLTIEDTMADWVTRGTLSFLYNPAILSEYTINPDTGGTASAQTGTESSFISERPGHIFRNDGYDLLRVKIKPNISSETSNLDINGNLDNTDDPHWTISHLFTVYDMEDIDLPPGAQNQASAPQKCIKLYFWDAWYQKLISTIMEYSTAESSEADIDADRVENKYANLGTLNTGTAMKEIIEIGLSETSIQKTATSKPDNLAIGATYEPVNDKLWDKGQAKIFYTAPAGASAFDSLMYVANKHISSESDSEKYDVCFLAKDRGPKEDDYGQFTLIPISKIFEKAGSTATKPGEYQIEHFFVQSYTKEQLGHFRAPLDYTNRDPKVDLQNPKFGAITSFRFVDMAPYTNTLKFTNRPVHSFDFKNRTYNIEFEKNSATTARQFIGNKYINQLYSKSGDKEQLFLATLNSDKKTLNTRPAYSLHGDDPDIRQSEGLSKLLKTGLLLNTAINFRTLGLTSRQTCRFIGIDKTQGEVDGQFADKLYGQWFIINVKHVIEGGLYYNDITAVKIHRFNDLSSPFPNTI